MMEEKHKDLDEEIKANPKLQLEAVEKNIKQKTFKTATSFAKPEFVGKTVTKMGTFGKASKKEQEAKGIADQQMIGKRGLSEQILPKPQKKVNTQETENK